MALLEEGLSLDGIAARVGRAPSTISYWLAKHSLAANGAARFAPKGALSRDALADLVSEGLSVRAMAERLSCSPAMVRRALKRNALSTRQSENRALARAALQRGDRNVRLVCAHHGQTRHVLEGRGTYRCCRCRARAVVERRRQVKRILVSEAGGECHLCGYDRSPAALEFHHLDPAVKSFELSLRGVTRSIDVLRDEASKCVLLCANCHAEIEAGHAAISVDG